MRLTPVILAAIAAALCLATAAVAGGPQAVVVLNRTLYNIDLATGQLSSPRTLTGPAGTVDLIDAEFGPHALLYGLSTRPGNYGNTVFRINPLSATASFIDGPTFTNIVEGDLAIEPHTGHFYGIQDVTKIGQHLFRFDIDVGTTTIIGPVQPPIPPPPPPGSNSRKPVSRAQSDLSAMTFDGDGNLWVLDTKQRRLLLVDKNTATILASEPAPISGATAGMTFNPDDGFIYGVDGDPNRAGNLWKLKPGTAKFTLVGNVGVPGNLSGISILPAAGPPAAAGLGAVVNFANFDCQNSGELQNSSGTFSVVAVPGHDGHWLRSNPPAGASGYGQIMSVVPDGLAGPVGLETGYFLFRFFYQLAPTSGDEPICLVVADGGSPKLEVRLDSDSHLRFYTQGFAYSATSATALAPDTEYVIALKSTTGPASPAYEWRLYDGETLAVLESGAGGTNLGGIPAVGLRLGKGGDRAGNAVDFYYKGVVVAADAALYNSPNYEFGIKLPVADGAFTDFTGAEPRWQALSALPLADSSYVLSNNTMGAAMTVRVQSNAEAGIAASSIYAVRPIIWAKRQGGSSHGLLRTRVRSRNVNSDNPLGGVTPIFNEVLSQMMIFDPATGAPWLPEALDHVEIGAVEASTAVRSRFMAAHLLVMYKPITGR